MVYIQDLQHRAGEEGCNAALGAVMPSLQSYQDCCLLSCSFRYLLWLSSSFSCLPVLAIAQHIVIILSFFRINAIPYICPCFPGWLHWQMLRGKSSAGKNRAPCSRDNLHQLTIGHLDILKYPSLRSSLLLNEENAPSHLFFISKHHEYGWVGFWGFFWFYFFFLVRLGFVFNRSSVV